MSVWPTNCHPPMLEAPEKTKNSHSSHLCNISSFPNYVCEKVGAIKVRLKCV